MRAGLGFQQKLGLLALGAGTVVLLLFARAVTLQLLEHDQWKEEAAHRASLWRPLRASRGAIVDASGRRLAGDAASFDLLVQTAAWRSTRHECRVCGRELYLEHEATQDLGCRRCRSVKSIHVAEEPDLAPLAKMLGLSQEDLWGRIEHEWRAVEDLVKRGVKNTSDERADRRRRALELDYGWRPRLVLRDVSYEVAREVTLHRRRYPALLVETVFTRRQNGGAAFTHILGRTRPTTRAVMRDDGRTLNARVDRGIKGLEARFDALLQGEAGWVERAHDPRGESEGEVLALRRPRPGYAVQLTIDQRDQQLGYEQMGGEQGAFVVVNAQTGAVLVMVSTPSYEPDEYRRTYLEWQRRAEAAGKTWLPGTPLVDRACTAVHVPGSVFKPFTAAAALADGVCTPDRVIRCEHYFKLDGKVWRTRLRCNGTHGDVDLRAALAHSCNIYFQTLLAEMLETQLFPHFVAMGRSFGFGCPTGLEIEGDRPAEAFRFDDVRTQGSFIGAAIGQGVVEVSPAQVARAYAGLLTGRVPRLHVVARIGGRAAPISSEPVAADDAALRAIREGLYDVPKPGNSGAGHGLAAWGIACKTGTAQISRSSHNAWMAGFAKARGDRPDIAFAMVLLDTSLSGSEACGPRLRRFFEGFYGRGAE